MALSISVVGGASAQGTSAGSYLPNLSAIVDDTSGKYTDAQKIQAYRDREARDESFTVPAFQASSASGDSAAFWRKYIAFLDKLSPEEQNSPRYRGTRQAALTAIAAGNGPNPGKPGEGVSLVEQIRLDGEKAASPAKHAQSQAAQAQPVRAGAKAHSRPAYRVLDDSREFDRLNGPGTDVRA